MWPPPTKAPDSESPVGFPGLGPEAHVTQFMGGKGSVSCAIPWGDFGSRCPESSRSPDVSFPLSDSAEYSLTVINCLWVLSPPSESPNLRVVMGHQTWTQKSWQKSRPGQKQVTGPVKGGTPFSITEQQRPPPVPSQPLLTPAPDTGDPLSFPDTQWPATQRTKEPCFLSSLPPKYCNLEQGFTTSAPHTSGAK